MNANQLVLDTGTSDVPDYLNSFGFALDTTSKQNNTKIKMNIPNGLDVTVSNAAQKASLL